MSDASASEQPAIIDVRNIVKHFGPVIALSGVSLTVRPGQVHCLLGDNGAGKSTFIKTLAGVHRPTMGPSWSTASRSDFRARETPSTPASPRSTRTWR